jgi:hypothetical protein
VQLPFPRTSFHSERPIVPVPVPVLVAPAPVLVAPATDYPSIENTGPSCADVARQRATADAMAARATAVYYYLDRHGLWPEPIARSGPSW